MTIIVTNNYPPTHGGIQTLMSRIAECLAEKNGEVIVVGPAQPDSARYDAAASYRTIRYSARTRPWELIAIALAYMRALRAGPAQLTIASAWWPVALALIFVPRRRRGTLAIFAHGTEVSPRRKGIRRLVMRAVFWQADVIITYSSFTGKLLKQAGVGGNIAVVMLGVDTQPIAPARAAAPTILSVGRLVERKGFDRVIESLPVLRSSVPDVRYEIVGSGPQRDALEGRAQQLDVAAHVTFLGNVTQEQLKDAYARAWCFALPVRNVDDDVEGFGIVYLEAAMASLPAVGGIESGATDAIVEGETGLLVDGTSVSAVTDALATLLGNRELAEDMGRRGLARARELTWMRTTEEILARLALPYPSTGRRTGR